jgi:outer membrane protein assembly factor BamB
MISGLSFLRLGTPVLLLAVVSVHAEWPQWRGPLATAHLPANVSFPERLPADPRMLWRVPLGDGYTSPVVAGGKLFILDKIENQEVVRAFDAKSGQELWTHALDEAYDDNQGKGPRSTALVDGDRLYVTSCRGEFRCLRVADGSPIWSRNFVRDFKAIFLGEIPNPIAIGASRHGNNGSPLIEGEHIFIQAGGTNGASIVCLKKKTGEPVWQSQDDQAGYAGAQITEIAGRRQFIAFTAEGVIGLGLKDGKLLWRFPIKTTWARHVTTPVVVGDMVMVSSHQHGLFGIRVAREGRGFKAEQAWLTKPAAINFASPVAVGKFLYGLGPAKNLICVDSQTGEIAWSKDGYISTAPSKAHASFLVAGDSIVVLTDAGQLIQFAADPKEFRELSRAQVSGVTWCSPAYSNGTLYLRDMRQLLAVALK